MAKGNSQYRLGADVGGTFTDIVLLGPNGEVGLKKVSSTPGQFEEAIITGVEQLLKEEGVSPESIQEMCHGTTAATNAVLERRGAKVGLITTKGFRDVLELRRLRTPKLYDLFYTPPEPLVPRYLRLEVEERLDAKGNVLQPLDVQEARKVIDILVKEEVNSVAVCLLNSFVNPIHERMIGELLQKEYPDLSVSLSCEVIPAIKEYERTSTVVVNAYVMPMMSRYLRSLRERLTGMGLHGPLSVMQSSGGMMTAQVSSQKPIFSLESGPAAGVAASLFLAQQLGVPNAVTFDMGGTTTKAAIIENGEAHKAPDYEVGAPISRGSRLLKGGGYLLMVRAVDLAEVGAGGGSIVSVDIGGSFQVGPRSAGADPGPVCYDRGGTEPTMTDCNLILGYLNPEYLVGGAVRVNAEKAQAAFEQKVARPLNLPLLHAAHGAHLVANATMARAIRAVSTERGRDVRNFALFAFGGSGPVHVAELARSLSIRHMVVPFAPGLFSAFGLLVAPQEYEFVRSMMVQTDELTLEQLEESYKSLKEEALGILRRDGYAAEQMGFTRLADMHYVGQVHELTVPVPSSDGLKALEEAFGQEHNRTYGYISEREPIEITNIRVVARNERSEEELKTTAALGKALYQGKSQNGSRKAYFGREDGLIDTPLVSRADLSTAPTEGPMILEEYDTTIIVPPRCRVSRDDLWSVVLDW